MRCTAAETLARIVRHGDDASGGDERCMLVGIGGSIQTQGDGQAWRIDAGGFGVDQDLDLRTRHWQQTTVAEAPRTERSTVPLSSGGGMRDIDGSEETLLCRCTNRVELERAKTLAKDS